MIKKILLINTPFQFDHFYEKDFFSKGRQSPLFPFGIAYIASYLKKFGYDVEILDIYAQQLREEEVIEELKTRSFDLVGISALVTQYQYIKGLTETIKRIKDAPIVLGNGLATACHKLVLQKVPTIDICVRGEGEITFKELIDKNGNLNEVLGISFRDKDGKVIVNPDRPPCRNIDEFPWPAYELFDMSLYLKTRIYETGILDMREKLLDKRILPALSSRGCPYNCNFCGKVIPVGRLRAVDDVVNEIKFLKDNYKLDGIHFIDELFVVNKKRAIELSKALKPLGLIWDCQARANTIALETLEAMKDSGCVAVGLGVESGSQKILDNMNKRITVHQIEEVMKAAIKVNLPIKVQLIFGYPGEDYETLEETVSLFKRVGHPGRAMSAIVPIPGTSLWEYAKKQGLVEDNEEFLDKVQEGFDKNACVVNFTNFDTQALDDLRQKYDSVMEDNYVSYTLRHPWQLIAALRFKPFRVLLLVKVLKKFGMYNFARKVRGRAVTLKTWGVKRFAHKQV